MQVWTDCVSYVLRGSTSSTVQDIQDEFETSGRRR